jgi:IclR family KDG regulon transcriptional repressor
LPASKEPDKKAPVTSLVKALRVLDSFSLEQPEQGVTEIAERLGINKSTVYNILSTCEAMGYVQQDPHTRRYRLGLHILRLGQVVREGMDLRRVVLPIMERVRDHYREAVHFSVELNGQVVYLETVQPSERSVASLTVGKSAYMHCTGVGKAILAHMPLAQAQAIISEQGMARYTKNTITDLAELEKELEKIRQQGYAIDNMEYEWGIRCIAVPIRNESGDVRASMSISGPSERLPLETIAEMAQPLIRFGADVSRRLGWLR